MAINTRGSYRPRGRHNVPEESHRINHHIKVPKIRLISDSGEMIGIISVREGIVAAEEAGLDLVEVSPNTDPPVCKLMDYGKFKYREQKKSSEAKKKRTEVTTKELRIRYRTDVGDLETKLKKARAFLEAGDKVKFSMRFRGREAMYLDLGNKKLQEIIDRLSDISTVDIRSPLAGRQIFIILAPQKS